MIHRMYVLTAGSAERNLGNITATADVDGTVTAQITATVCQTAMAIYQVPAGTTGYLCAATFSINKAGGVGMFADMAIMLKDFGGVWRVQDTFACGADGVPHIEHPYVFPPSIPAKGYIKLAAAPSADALDVSGSFALILVDGA